MTDTHRDSGRINRRDLIIETATRLFSEQGYTATSVRQIAELVGCTEAALYYHFKDGKRALLQAVLECEMPKLTSIINGSENATSLQAAMKSIAMQMDVVGPERMEKMRWILGEFHRLSEEEKALFHESHLRMHHIIAQVLRPFVDSDEYASRLAWIFFAAGFGYGLLFWNLEMQDVANFSLHEFMETLIPLLVSQQPTP